MNTFYRHILWVSVSYWLIEALSLVRHNNKCGKLRLHQCHQDTFKDSLVTKTIVSTQSSVFWENGSKPCLPEYLNKWAVASPVQVMNGLFKTTFLLKLLYKLNTLSHGKPEQCIWTAEASSVTMKWHFQDHLSTKISYCL